MNRSGRHLVLSIFSAVTVLCLASACSTADSSALPSVASQALPTAPTTTTTTPTTPTTPTTTVETFTGSFSQGSYGVHPFTQAVRGPLTVTLTALGPDDTLTIGAGIGSWDGATCVLISGAYSDTAKVGWSVTGTAIAGNFCAAIYDAGSLAADATVSYTFTVEHS